MSRRKQARPSRANLEDELVQGALRINPQLGNLAIDAREDNESASDGEESAGGGTMGDEAVDLTSARSHHEDEMDERDPEDPSMPLEMAEDEDMEEQDEPEDFDESQRRNSGGGPKKLAASNDEDEEDSRKHMHLCQDAENNNSFVEGGPPAGVIPPAGTSHVTLEALENTKVAVAQFAATALAGGADSEAAFQDLAVLQSTLFTLQHQQVFQLQLIKHLQQQLTSTAQPTPSSASLASGEGGSVAGPDSKEASPSPAALIHPKPLSSLTSPAQSRPPSHHQLQQQPSPSSTPVALPTQDRQTPSGSASPLSVPLVATIPGSTITPPTTSSGPMPPSHQVPALCSISSSLASSIITNNDPLPLHEPNTLEMLQKRAQEVLDNASQGLLANNLADELAFRGSGGKGSRLSPYDGKSGSGRGEHFFKHRCRYCGKVFGSDSALQIHIRSHTGERPFKCNVCGSRFTTKGNLKVHFQRHRDKFPHVKMNPNPVPEHLDKFHPPLLQTLAVCGQRPINSPPPPPPPMPPHTSSSSVGPHPSPGAPPFHSPIAHVGAFLPPQPPLPLGLALPGMPTALYRSPLLNSSSHREDQDVPENLSKPLSSQTTTSTAPTTPSHSATHSPAQSPGALSNSHHSFNEHCQKSQQQLTQERRDEIVKMEQEQALAGEYQQPPRPNSREVPAEGITPKNEPEDADEMNEDEGDEFDDQSRRYMNSSPSMANQASSVHQQMYEDCSMESKVSGRLEGDAGEMECEDDMDEQPENLSNRANPASMLQQSMIYPGASPASSSASSGSLQTSFASILFTGLPPHPHLASHHSSSQAGNQNPSITGITPGTEPIDPARDPAIYSSLLPRPGSNDNSWESLIEITKTSETSKLQQLVDNIEHKLTDPNQCIICQRVLSCKSALQMHYRTHTGERPFKCKICGRAFTTKGNLKTHMGVHRAKPPLRLLHQCTVCHKKFSNSFVLQQHVNLHTNDPTELTPEQIRAAEVHDFPPGYPHHPLAAFLPQGFPPLHPGAFPLGFPPTARQHALERLQSMENDVDSKDSLQHQQQQQLQQLQQQRFMEEHGGEEVEDVEDEEEDRREDDERCEEPRERRNSLEADEDKEPDVDQDNDRKDNIISPTSSIPSFSTSLAVLENQVRAITTMANSHQLQSKSPPPPLHRYNGSEKSNSPPGNPASLLAPLDLTPRASSTPASVSSAPITPPNTHNVSNPQTHHPPHPFGMFAGLLQAVTTSPTANSNSVSGAAGPNAVSPGPGIGPLASLTTSAVRAATSTYNPLGLAVGGSAVRGNTTCNICYKTFACNSALEIHYRSHTKERPFKCSICDRGFSTKSDVSTAGKSSVEKCNCAERARRSAREKARRRRRAEERRGRTGLNDLAGRATSTYAASSVYGDVRRLPPLMPSALGLLASDPSVFLGNMKQHMLTHKIRDMPHHLFSDAKPPISQPQQCPQQQQQQQQPPPPPPQQQLLPSNQPMHEHLQQQQQQLQREQSRSPASADESNLPPPPPPPMPSVTQAQQQQQAPTPLDATILAVKKPENDLLAPKRPPSMSSKHLCHVCNKNFSSSSALQIHMRTHTGDKPFQCNICQKAFTTKGNLKVHTGTHMWTNGASRRGRRMSLDIPSLPITPKDSEFLQRRPDLFYPYLPAPFLNGMPQKLNEISVIQGSNGLPTLPPSHPVGASKYAGLFGSVFAAGAGFPPANHLGGGPEGNKAPQTPPQSADGSLLFQSSTPPSPAQSPGGSHWPNSAEAMQRHHYAAAAQRAESDGSPTTRLPPPPPAPRGEGLAA